LSGNQISGTLPTKLELPFIGGMDLSKNSFSGKLPVNLTAPSLREMLLYNNNFTGTIPAYVCYGFNEINLSNNRLTGDSPQCPRNDSLLFMVDLKYNNLSGKFPHFLQNAAGLVFLDLSHNKFSGSMPTWIAEKMPRLEVLILRSNMFYGHLPKQITKLIGLHYLDLAHNNISGSLPSSLARLRSMAHSSSNHIGEYNYSSDSISTFIKDRELNYTHELTKHIVLIDLSSNGFTGYIPKELSLLKGLRSLNLSGNQISGPISDDIGALRELESLDLSYNHFTGEIPSSLADFTFLSCLNLSYNDLSGRIPSGQQLQTINNQYMYIGNSKLCGPPLVNSCSTNETNPNVNQGDEGAKSSLYLSMSIGFVMGLWSVFCTMLFMKTWRYAYFHLLDQLYEILYVQVAVSKAAFVRKFENEEK
jgi:Leucine-rich repeat (LRR) protein